MSNILFVFWTMELQEKLLLRFTDLFQELLSEFIGIPLTKEAGCAYYIIKGYLGIQLFTLNTRLVGSVSRDALNKQG